VDSDGLLDLAEAELAINDDTAVVSVMWANNETGVVFPVEEIGRLAKEHGALFHCDAVQAVGKLPVDVSRSTAIDYLSASGHKLHAPKGVGALYVRRGTPFAPFLIGGHQEHNRRAGTENVASIVGFGKAAELARGFVTEEQTRVRGLRDRLEQGLLTGCPDAHRNGATEPRLPNTSSISFDYVEGEAILLSLSDLGICASSGSACTSGSLEPSHVLRAMGVPFTRVHGSLRLSLSVYTTDEEVDYVLEHLPPVIRRLRALSPFGH
jgi:cysteine desulfurase